MTELKRLLGLLFLTAVLASCTSISSSIPEALSPEKTSLKVQTRISPLPSPLVPIENQFPSPISPLDNSFSTLTPLTSAGIAACQVTFPNGSQPPYPSLQYPGAHRPPGRHGNDVLWADIGTGGKILVQSALVQADGSIDWKMGWHRGVRGKLTVVGT